MNEKSDRKVEQTPGLYDDMYDSGGYQGVYNLPVARAFYYRLFQEVKRELKRRNLRDVLEVGCGVGWFAQMMLSDPSFRYHGFDFSPIAVQRAQQKTGSMDSFFVGDATNEAVYEGTYDVLVCTEVLEHIPNDQEVVAHWPAGRGFVCSVPNYDASNHERYFITEEDVLQRYGGALNIERINRLTKPVISDIGLKSRLRELRWSRYRPSRFLKVLGLGLDFETDGGWFVFSGRAKGGSTK